MAVASEYGMEVANRLNRVAAHEVGKVETHRIVRASGLPPVKTIDDWLLAQELFVAFLGPQLMDYRLLRIDDRTSEVHVQRCFANENATRAGVADQIECGVFTRITGWLDALGPKYEISPPLGKCLKAQGLACAYRLTLKPDADTARRGTADDRGGEPAAASGM